LVHDNGVNWRYQIQELWTFLDSFARVEANSSCGTHIHVSPPLGVDWHIEYLRRIAKTLIHFEPAIEVLLPEHRRSNLWAKANRADHPQFKVRTVQQAWTRIDTCQDIPELVALINPKVRPTDEDYDRYYAWNFTNLLEGGIGTIEFRRPPGVTKMDSCICWIEFTVAFVRAGANFGASESLNSFQADVNGLKRLLRLAIPPGKGLRDLFGRIFTNKSGSLNPVSMRQPTPDEVAMLEMKTGEQKDKNVMLKKILKLGS